MSQAGIKFIHEAHVTARESLLLKRFLNSCPIDNEPHGLSHIADKGQVLKYVFDGAKPMNSSYGHML